MSCRNLYLFLIILSGTVVVFVSGYQVGGNLEVHEVPGMKLFCRIELLICATV